MKRAIWLLCGTLSAQTLSITSSAPTVEQGKSVLLEVRLTNATVTSIPQISAIGWDTVLPSTSGLTISTPAVGVAGTAALKNLQCNLPPCIVSGQNRNVIGDGSIAQYSLNAPAGSPLGPVTLSLANIVGANPNADGVAVQAGAPIIVTVVSPPPVFDITDLNKDGKTDLMDLQIGIDQALKRGGVPCTSGDVNADGFCNARDVQAIANKIP